MSETKKIKTRQTLGKMFTWNTLHTIVLQDRMDLTMTSVAAILDDEVRKMCKNKFMDDFYGGWYRGLNDRAYKRLLNNIWKEINPKRKK